MFPMLIWPRDPFAISLLTAHVTTVPQNVLWEMVSYSNHKEKDMQELRKVVETSGKTR